MAQRVGRGIALLFHNRGIRRGVSNEEQEPTDINVLQLRVLTDIFKIFKIQKDEIRIVLIIGTAL